MHNLNIITPGKGQIGAIGCESPLLDVKTRPSAAEHFCQAIDETISSEGGVIDSEHIIDLAVETILHCKSLIIREKREMTSRCIK